jgi:O-antigen/teichoic acid export membrane protein
LNKQKNIDFLKSFILALCVRSLGALSVFALNYVVAKNLSTADAGYFLWMLSALVIGVQLAIMGFHDVALKYIAQTSSMSDWGSANYISKKITHWTLTSTTLFAIFLYLLANHISNVFFQESGEVGKVIQAMAPGLVFWGASTILSYKLQAVQKPLKAIFSLSIGPYLFFCIIFILLKTTSPIISGWIFTISCALNFFISAFWWKKESPTKIIAIYNNKELWRMALPMWGIAIMSVAVNWGAQFIAAIWVPIEDVAQYAVAIRASALINFFLIAVNFIAAPRIAQLHNENKKNELQTLITTTVKALYLFVTPILITIIFFSNELMSIFGEEFKKSGNLLLILSIGQLINVATGPVGYLLTMTGNERPMRNMYLISGLICILLIFLLTPIFGIEGAAWATASSIAIQNIGATFLVRSKLGISISPFYKRTNQTKSNPPH